MRQNTRSGPSRILVIAGIFLFMLITVVVGHEEIREIRYSLAYDKHDELCRETSDPQACGMAATMLARAADTTEEMGDARARFTDLCKRAPGKMACRIYTTLHTPRIGTVITTPNPTLEKSERARAFDACVKETDARGCYVAADIVQNGEERAKVLSTSLALCDEGEKFACWALYDRIEKSKKKEILKKVCAAGYEPACEDLGTAPADDVAWCRRGHPASCEQMLALDLNPIEEQVYRALASNENWTRNPGFEGIKLEEIPPGVVDTCKEGDAAACFGAGLYVVKKETSSWRPELPPRMELDLTFGKACYLGFDAACKAYALRLLDRPFGEERDIENANLFLGEACENGDPQACWMMNFEDDLLRDDYSGLREAAATACSASRRAGFGRGSGPCATLRNILSVEIGAAPWVHSDRIATPLYRRFCEQLGDHGTCARGAWLMAWTCHSPGMEGGPCMRTSLWEVATTGCFAGSSWACETVSYAPIAVRSRSSETVEEVVGRLCEKLPNECDTVKEARGLD